MLSDGQAFADGGAVAGDRTLRIDFADPDRPSVRDFFTFRTPQPSMFAGQVTPNMWGWLEVHPQHVFRDEAGRPEEMTVGVAQNAIPDTEVDRLRREAGADEDTPAWEFLAPSAGNGLGVHGALFFSDPRSRGRGYHGGRNDASRDAILRGDNFAEQWERALEVDPFFIFVTGWNEWFAGNLPLSVAETIGETSVPLFFCDSYNQAGSRDVEPMKGGHGDNYYYQMVSNIRRFKGVRALPPASPPKTIDLAGGFGQWADVRPEYRDTIGDTVHRDHPGFNTVTRYRNTTGRNDLVAMKVARDAEFLYFHARTEGAISEYTDPDWMVLFLNTDRDHSTGWEGYDIAINRRIADDTTSVVEHTANGWNWQPKGTAQFVVEGEQLMLAIPREVLGLPNGAAIKIEFKWADNFRDEDNVDAFTLNGDSAPPGRFNYHYMAE